MTQHPIDGLEMPKPDFVHEKLPSFYKDEYKYTNYFNEKTYRAGLEKAYELGLSHGARATTPMCICAGRKRYETTGGWDCPVHGHQN